MERDEVSTFLGGVLRAKFAYFRCLRQSEELEEKCTALSSSLSSTEGHGTADVHRDNMLIALADKKAMLPYLYAKWIAVMQEVDRFLDEIEDDRHRAILKLRYVDLLRWPNVVEELKKVGIWYEERQVHNLHGDALKVARALWAEKKESESHELHCNQP